MNAAEKGGGGLIWVVMRSSILAHPGESILAEARLPSQICPIQVSLGQKAGLMAQGVKT